MKNDSNKKLTFTLAEGTTHVKKCHSSRRIAFTLAEVLITLGIIGIVSAMTIPTLVKKFEEKRTVALLKETYSMLSQAMIYVVDENGFAEHWKRPNLNSMDDPGIYESTIEIVNSFKKHLKVIDNCESDITDRRKCWRNNDRIVYLGSADDSNYAFTFNSLRVVPFILANGAQVALYLSSEDHLSVCNNIGGVPCGIFFIKTDNKKENILGKNVFQFGLYNDRILPKGHPKAGYESFANQCNQKGGILNSNGTGCTAWVIENENMDYLRCDDLSWEGKRKCDE